MRRIGYAGGEITSESEAVLETKVDIVQNAIDMAQALDVALPKVAILSAVETVTPKIPSTIDAAALCKMAERGQITGGLLHGPLAPAIPARHLPSLLAEIVDQGST